MKSRRLCRPVCRCANALLWAALVWAAVSTPLRAADPAPKRPNILWLIGEDFGNHLSCAGVKEVWTPNLDRMAAHGVWYPRFYTTAPVCSASRSAFITGMYQTTIGAHHHRSHRDDGYRLPDGVRIVTDRMRELGYFTANLRTLPKDFGFNGTGKTDWNFLYEGKPFDTDRWDDLSAHQPFFAQINFSETHRQGRAGPEAGPWHSPVRADPAKVELPPYYPEHPVTRKDWAGYLDAATELDRKVGLVLEQLQRDGLADNTIVFFMGDNGQAHVRGKQFCYEEGLNVPLIVRWPKGFPMPQGFKPGTIDKRLLVSIDLAPTFLDIAGGQKPAKMQGEIFLGAQASPPRKYVFGARDRCDETTFRFRTVRDDRYRYIRNFMPERPFLSPNAYKERSYPVWSLLKELDAQGKLTPAQKFLTAPTMPAEELYDLTADPYEINNLAQSTVPEHQAALKRLRGVLEQWIVDTDDQGRTAEPPEVAAAQGATKPAGQGKAGRAGQRKNRKN